MLTSVSIVGKLQAKRIEEQRKTAEEAVKTQEVCLGRHTLRMILSCRGENLVHSVFSGEFLTNPYIMNNVFASS